ncbi:DUF3040 domain-containing protein [Streptomyces sp. NBC_00249]|uniref:DUF3040 domain-containing protein n=1 Tax=Streptomyces sp. NBC_00249 TaxID=2975690 RepID=UPI00224FE1EC|nr:DUF3040 domain-containing protein [Streptomyces sp. NBC_00249]MCX5195437.1 DUF3040 domain-containing protein [Streptomyces sp. NBC_00249]
MQGRELSRRERKTLADIERVLRRDPAFERRIVAESCLFCSCPAPDGAGRSRLPALARSMVLLSLGLLVSAAATSAPALIWAFVVVYAATLAVLALLVRRWLGQEPPGSRGGGP